MIVETSTHPAGVSAAPGTGGPSLRRAERPDVDVRFLMRRLNLYRGSPEGRYSLARGRRDWQLAIKAFGSREPVRSVAERRFAGPGGQQRIRIYTPAAGVEPRPVLAWIHGGGFILGDLYTAGGTCRALANRSGAIVVAIQYRLAPEHALRDGQEDCLAAALWLREHAQEIGGDPDRIAVGGDSAGGALAARVAQRCAELDVPLALQVLVYPATDLAGEYPSHSENAVGYMLTSENIEWIRGHLREVSDLADPELSPLRTANLSGLPAAVVVTAGYDPLRDEGLAYAARLREAGVAVRALHYADHIHGFMSFDRVLGGGRDVLERIGANLQSGFAEGGFASQQDGLHVGRGRPWPRALTPAGFAQRYNETRVTQVMVSDWTRQQAFAAISLVWRLATARPGGTPRS